MFEYFPDNYPWSLAVMMAITAGGQISEIDAACRELVPLSTQPGPKSAEAWSQSWRRLAEKLAADAAADRAQGRLFSAGRKHRRASTYFMMAERMMRHVDPRREGVYRQMLEHFAAWQATEAQPAERVEVPYEGTTLPALFIRAEGARPDAQGRLPCMVMFDGFDIMKETICLMDIHEDWRRRGISMLIVDHPGVGEALRLQGLHGMPETERPATASLEYLLARGDIDPSRIGIIAPSAGGYHAVRAAALEPRFACCVAWTGVWDWGGLFEKRLRGALAQSVHFHLAHAEWVYGAKGVDGVIDVVRHMNLEGIAGQLRCPLLITHGGNDRQTPVSEAHKVMAATPLSTDKELRVFTLAEGSAEHVHVDNQTPGTDYMADWVARRFDGRLGA
jgi:dienelactone hydrolase